MNMPFSQPQMLLSGQATRLPYVAPCVTELGDLRDLTLGASPGVGDSGSVTTFKCPGCP